jgi:hypothetical protein
MTSDEYGQLLNRIREEVETSAAAFYTFKEINRFALEGGANYDKLNRDARFWNLQIHALQTAYFMGLGRLFDTASNVDSLIHLLDATDSEPKIFSREELAERKRKAANDPDPPWLAPYLATAWQPTIGELHDIRDQVEPSIRVYRDRYAAIRNKVFAHIEKNQQLVANAVNKTLVSDIDMMFLDMLEVIDMLHALFDNGVNRGRRIGPHPFAREVQARTLAVLNRL